MDSTLMLLSTSGAAPAATSAGARPGPPPDGGAQPDGPGFPALLDDAAGRHDALSKEQLPREGSAVEGVPFIDWWLLTPLTSSAAPSQVVGGSGTVDDGATDGEMNGIQSGKETGAGEDAGAVAAIAVAGDVAPAAIVGLVSGLPGDTGGHRNLPGGGAAGTAAPQSPGASLANPRTQLPVSQASSPIAAANASMPDEAAAGTVEVAPSPDAEGGAHGPAAGFVPESPAEASEESLRAAGDTNGTPAGNPASLSDGLSSESLAAAASAAFDGSSRDGAGERHPGTSSDARQQPPSAGEPARMAPAVHAGVLVGGIDGAVTQAPAGMPAATDVPSSGPGEPSQDTLHHLVQAMRTQFRNGVGEAVVRLNPEHLGAVSIALRVEQGAVSATVVADTPHVRRWLETQEPALRQGLAAQGLHLDRFAVEPDDRHAHQRRQDSPEPRRRAPREDDRQTFAAVFDVVV